MSSSCSLQVRSLSHVQSLSLLLGNCCLALHATSRRAAFRADLEPCSVAFAWILLQGLKPW